jgi:hypothetical protein
MMNEHLNELRLEAGIARLEDDPWLVVINKEGNVIDPLIGLEKFAELIIQECIAQVKLELGTRGQLLTNPPENAGVWYACNNIRRHFGVE